MSEFASKFTRLIVASSFVMGAACTPIEANHSNSKTSLDSFHPAQTTPNSLIIPNVPTTEPIYVTPTVEQSKIQKLVFDESKYSGLKEVEIDGIKYSLDNICGPLAADILMNSGFWPKGRVVPHDFWKLDPFRQPDRVNKLFPLSLFTRITFNGPTELHDFKKDPLKLGDFVYLYSAKNNGFDHMLAVTEIDEDGTAWTTSNEMQQDGSFRVVGRTELYNPNFTPDSIWYNPNAPLLQGHHGVGSPWGRTGAKFEVFRLK